jgi:hypothetical protein
VLYSTIMSKQETTQLSMYIDGVILGGIEEYRKAIDIIRIYRQLARMQDARALMCDAAVAKPFYTPYDPPTKKKGRKKKKKKSHGPRLVTDRALARRIGALMASEGENDNPGKAALYEHRAYWMSCVKAIAEAGGPYLSSKIYDSSRIQLNALRNTAMSDYGNASKNWLALQGIIDPLKLRNLGVPVLRTGSENCAWFLRDERGWVLRLQYGRKEDYLDILIHGEVEQDGRTYSARLDSRYKWIIRKMLEDAEGWSWQTPILNMREKKSGGRRTPTFWLQIPYRRPAKRGVTLKKGKVCEVTFQRQLGSELPRKKNDRGTDDNKTFIIHADSGSWSKHISVDGIKTYMTNRLVRRRDLELVRDGRRRMPKRFVRPLKQTLDGLTKSRENRMRQQNHIWAKELVQFAVRARCSEIRVFNLPDSGLLLDDSISWSWFQFKQLLEYKAKDRGIVVTEATSDMSEVGEALEMAGD